MSPRFLRSQQAEAAGAREPGERDGLSPPDKLALIKQNCADTNRRISDFISQAIDDYLSKRR
jgi:hypothetical protein